MTEVTYEELLKRVTNPDDLNCLAWYYCFKDESELIPL